MFKNYFKLAYRNLSRNKLSSLINIFGLSTALGCSIVAFLFVDFYYNRDTFHENAEQIFLIENIVETNGHEQIWGNSPVPLGPALKADFPQVMRTVRVAYGKGIIRYEDNIFDEYIHFVDEEFLDMFTFPLKYGKKNALIDRNALVFSEEAAVKYFGDENPISEKVTIIFNDKYKESFLVKGVTEKLPENASFGFNILVPYNKQLDIGIRDFHDWSKLNRATFIQLHNPDEINTIKTQINRYIQLQNAADVDRPMKEYIFEPLLKIAQNSYKVREDIVFLDLYPGQLLSLFFGSLFLILLACFNYMNIAIVSATRRFKEIGVRKVVGSNKINLIIQFLGENLLLCSIALFFGIVLAELIFAPGFNNFFHAFNFRVDLLGNPGLLVFLLVMLLATGLGAGIYPAFYISAFRPVDIFRRRQKISSNNFLTKVLLTLQFIFSIIAVTNGIIFIQNNKYQRNRDWGYNQKQRIVVPIDDKSRFTIVRDVIKQNSDVLRTAGSEHHIGSYAGRVGIEILEKKYDVVKFNIGYDYTETMGLRLKQGRSFRREMRTDINQSIIVNETFVKSMNWQDAIGKRILYENKPYYVIGVVEDFHYNNFMRKIEPTILSLVSEDQFNYLAISVKPGTAIKTANYIKEIWKTLIPDSPYMGFFQDSIFDEYNQIMLGVAKSSSFIALIALIITCMGIFGMVSLNIVKMMKEISIHKVLGASIFNIVNLVNKGFIKLIVIATIIGVPASYYLLKMFLDSLWEYHRDLDPIPFIFAVGIVLFSAALTISLQVYKAAVANPVDMLRDE